MLVTAKSGEQGIVSVGGTDLQPESFDSKQVNHDADDIAKDESVGHLER